MLNARDVSIDRAILSALAAVPADMLLGEDTLRADAARITLPRATTTELDARLRYLDEKRRIAGIRGEVRMQWQLTDAGRLWLTQNP